MSGELREQNGLCNICILSSWEGILVEYAISKAYIYKQVLWCRCNMDSLIKKGTGKCPYPNDLVAVFS